MVTKVSKQPLSRRKRRSLNIKFIWLSLGMLVILAVILWQPIANWLTISSANPEMVELARNAGMSEKGMLIFLRTNPQLETSEQFSIDCSVEAGEPELGCYDPNTNRIYILDMPIELYDQKVNTAAHEMLHAVYFGDKEIVLSNIIGPVLENYNSLSNDTTLARRIGAYMEDDSDTNTQYIELFSILGTEYSNLSTSLTALYNPYFLDISKTVRANDHIIEIFQSYLDQINQLAALIEQDDINANNAYANADIAYNNHASWAWAGNAHQADYNYSIYEQWLDKGNQYIEIENNHINQRNGLIDRYTTLNDALMSGQPISKTQTIQSQSPL